MARIFISHSSKNSQQARLIKEWLLENGFDHTFLDIDPVSGIPVASDWERVLYDEIERSQVVILILTPDWNSSKWCFSEYTQARALGKAIFPLIFEDYQNKQISGAIQYLDLSKDSPEAYQQLLKELTTLALNTQEGFEWDNNRSPYPGMLSFDEEDAAIFFGRDDDTLRVIEHLNARRTQGGSRLLTLLGSSGSGKSSLLKAGVLPRLHRDQRHWIILPIFRPTLRPVRRLAITFASYLDKMEEVESYYLKLMGDDTSIFLTEIADNIQQKAMQFDATILISVDQSEELFSTAETKEAEHFFKIISLLKHKESPWLCIFTLRSDFLGYLQNNKHLKTDFSEISLKQMPLSRIDQIIRGPAKVAGLTIDPELTAVATEDAKTQDALPLLAFALRQLYERYGSDGDLTLDEYKMLGDEKNELNPLENAIHKAADDEIEKYKNDKIVMLGLRQAFIPAMVRVNNKGEYVRRTANWDELPKSAYPILEDLAKARLLTIKQNGNTKLVEVCHEALLRKWPLLQTWLNQAHEFLVGKDQLEKSLQEWQDIDKENKNKALLHGLPLQKAKKWLLDYPNQLNKDENEYIQASTQYKELQQNKVRNRLFGFIAILIAVTLLALVQWKSALKSEEKAKNQLLVAKHNLGLTLNEKAQVAIDKKDYNTAQFYLTHALSKLQDQSAEKFVALRNINSNLDYPFIFSTPVANHHSNSIESVQFSLDSKTLVSGSSDKTIKLWDVASGKEKATLLGHTSAVYSVQFSPDGKTLVSGSGDKTIKLWDVASGKEKATLKGHTSAVRSVQFSPDGKTLVSGSSDKTIKLWDVASGKEKATLLGHTSAVYSVQFSPDGKTLVSGSEDKTIKLWDVASGKEKATLKGHSRLVFSVQFSPDGKTLVSGSEDKTIKLWDVSKITKSWNIKNWLTEIKKSKNKYNLKLEGITAVIRPSATTQNLYKNKVTSPIWSNSHPFHWLPKAENGDNNAMLRLGHIYSIENKNKQAIKWYLKAVEAGNKEAKEKLSILEKWIERNK